MNTQNALKAGKTFLWNGQKGCVRLLGDTTAVVDFFDGHLRHVKREILDSAVATCELVYAADCNSRHTARLKTDSRREAYCQELDCYSYPASLLSRRSVIQQVAEAIGDDSPPSASTLSRWYYSYIRERKTGQIEARIGRKRTKKASDLKSLYLSTYGHQSTRSEVLRDFGVHRSNKGHANSAFSVTSRILNPGEADTEVLITTTIDKYTHQIISCKAVTTPVSGATPPRLPHKEDMRPGKESGTPDCDA